MGSISGISGGGSIYQPKEPSPPDFSQLEQQVDDYFRKPTEANFFQAEMTIDQLLSNPNLTSAQKSTLQDVQAQLKQYFDLQNKIAQLEESNPSDPRIQKYSNEQEDLQMRIQNEESKLP